MRVNLCRIEDLTEGEEFFNLYPVKDNEGNVYLPSSKFLVTKY